VPLSAVAKQLSNFIVFSHGSLDPAAQVCYIGRLSLFILDALNTRIAKCRIIYEE
jgi:hypothetical protein